MASSLNRPQNQYLNGLAGMKFYIDVTAPSIESLQANYVTNEQIILVIKFKEDFFLILKRSCCATTP